MRLLFICFLLATTGSPVQGQKKKIRNPRYEQYIEKYRLLAIRQQHEYRIPASITLAQGLLESDGGKSRLALKGNNHFGIKCKSEWRGGRMYHDDDAKNECFRTYGSVEESYIDHSVFLAERKYYVSLFDLNIYDYKSWAYGLQKCGYATDKSYGSKLVGLIETYELYKYDKARIIEKTPIIDDIYEIRIHTSDIGSRKAAVNWIRRIHETNGIHYIEAQANDSYEFIAYDTRMTLKRLLKYNDALRGHKPKAGDRIYLQGKRRYAAKGNRIHVVRNGESLHAISQLYGMRLHSLYKLNRLNENYNPQVGDKLKLRK
jgi:LysM repeat protein